MKSCGSTSGIPPTAVLCVQQGYNMLLLILAGVLKIFLAVWCDVYRYITLPNNSEAAGHSLHNGHAEGLSQAGVQENVA